MLFIHLLVLISCKAYRADIMFQVDELMQLDSLRTQATDRNYLIRVNDLLELDVFTNKGERIIDPEYELLQENVRNFNQNQPRFRYLVQENGEVKLPIVGLVNLEGKTLLQAEEILENRYNEYYHDVFVKLDYFNKRVFVLGAVGGQVISLENENMNLVEVLALAGGLNQQSKAYNIRLIRGDLDHPEVQVIDLSTIEGMKKAHLQLEPNDIIYVEPVRRIFNESLRDITPALSLITSLITLMVLIRTL